MVATAVQLSEQVDPTLPENYIDVITSIPYTLGGLDHGYVEVSKDLRRRRVNLVQPTGVQLSERFGDHLIQLRKAHGYRSARALAEALGVSPNTILDLEASNQPTGKIQLLLRIQAIFRLTSIEQLLGPVQLALPSTQDWSREERSKPPGSSVR